MAKEKTSVEKMKERVYSGKLILYSFFVAVNTLDDSMNGWSHGPENIGMHVLMYTFVLLHRKR